MQQQTKLFHLRCPACANTSQIIYFRQAPKEAHGLYACLGCYQWFHKRAPKYWGRFSGAADYSRHELSTWELSYHLTKHTMAQWNHTNAGREGKTHPSGPRFQLTPAKERVVRELFNRQFPDNSQPASAAMADVPDASQPPPLADMTEVPDETEVPRNTNAVPVSLRRPRSAAETAAMAAAMAAGNKDSSPRYPDQTPCRTRVTIRRKRNKPVGESANSRKRKPRAQAVPRQRKRKTIADVYDVLDAGNKNMNGQLARVVDVLAELNKQVATLATSFQTISSAMREEMSSMRSAIAEVKEATKVLAKEVKESNTVYMM